MAGLKRSVKSARARLNRIYGQEGTRCQKLTALHAQTIRRRNRVCLVYRLAGRWSSPEGFPKCRESRDPRN